MLPAREQGKKLPASDLKGLTYIPFPQKRGRRFKGKQLSRLMENPRSQLRECCRKSDAWGLNGKWKQTWYVKKSDNFRQKNTSEAEVAVFGSRLRAIFKVKGKRYQLVARVSEKRMITGFWSGPTQNSYHGSCQLAMSPEAMSMKGKWLGFRANNEIEAGRWKFSRK